MVNKNDKQKLIKLMQENPDLPVVILVNNSEIAADYAGTVMKNFYAYKSEIYQYEQWGEIVWSDDKAEVIEYYADELYDEEGFSHLFNEDYDKAIENYVDENVEHYEAIIISAVN